MHKLWLSAAVLGGMTSSVAIAQAAAADAPADASEIIVTATKRAENLQNVPIAITAIGSDALAKAQIRGTDDLAISLSGVTIGYNAGGSTTFIRGIGSGDVTPGQEAAVATYVDGVYYSLPYGNHLAFNNIERVEVLKGPQGTLFGRNATGGLINVITKTPSADTKVDASLGYGNYQTVTAKFYGTTGIADKIAADIAVYYTDQAKGYGKNVLTGRYVNQSREIGVRSKWLLTPGDNTKITLIGDYDHTRSSTGLSYNLAPGTQSLFGAVNPPLGFYDVANNVEPYTEVSAKGLSGRLDQDFGFATLVSTTAYRHVNVDFLFDNDGTQLPIVNAGAQRAIGRTFSQEVQLVSNTTASDRYKWIAGAFYLHDKAGFGEPKGLYLFGQGIDVGGPGGEEDIVGVITTKSYSGFGEGSIKAGRAQLTVGARYTRDERALRSSITEFTATGVTAAVVAPPIEHAAYKKLTFRALLDYHLTDDVMTYASFSRGFKSGNFNTVNFANPSFAPEVLDAYEVGLKSQFFDRHLTLNAAGFYYAYSNLQLVSQRGNTQLTQNAGTARVYGLDVDSSMRFSRSFSIRGAFTYLDAKYTKFDGAVFNVALPGGGFNQVIGSAAGNRLLRTPKYSWNLGANYEIPSSIGTFTISPAYAHTGKTYWEADNLSVEPAYDLVNATVGWKNVPGTFGVNVYARNLLNEKYSIFTSTSPLSRLESPAAPRTYGVELTASF